MKESYKCKCCGKDVNVETAVDYKATRYGAYDLFNNMYEKKLCYKCFLENK